jgi:hypothetical protein
MNIFFKLLKFIGLFYFSVRKTCEHIAYSFRCHISTRAILVTLPPKIMHRAFLQCAPIFSTSIRRVDCFPLKKHMNAVSLDNRVGCSVPCGSALKPTLSVRYALNPSRLGGKMETTDTLL